MQEETLALLSCLAEVMSDQFAAHYARVMPGLKELLRVTPMDTKQQRELRGNAIQTIGNILDSVRDQPELCRQDALEIAQALIGQLFSNIMEDSDP